MHSESNIELFFCLCLYCAKDASKGFWMSFDLDVKYCHTWQKLLKVILVCLAMQAAFLIARKKGGIDKNAFH
jgi:hypothetical protein